MEKPRWFKRVLRTVGLMGEGEMGVRGRVRGRGERAAAAVVVVLRVGTARASLGRVARASILIFVGCGWWVVGGRVDCID